MILLFLGRSPNQGAILSTIKFIKQINLSMVDHLQKKRVTLLTKMYKTALGLRGWGEGVWNGKAGGPEEADEERDSKVKCGDPHWV